MIKLTPATDYSQIVRNEIYNSGLRDGSNAEGIDAVQANYASFRKNYVHDTATNGVYFKGGSVHTRDREEHRRADRTLGHPAGPGLGRELVQHRCESLLLREH